jgi:hypothetical protein
MPEGLRIYKAGLANAIFTDAAENLGGFEIEVEITTEEGEEDDDDDEEEDEDEDEDEEGAGANPTPRPVYSTAMPQKDSSVC